jgi:hypothetical protein
MLFHAVRQRGQDMRPVGSPAPSENTYCSVLKFTYLWASPGVICGITSYFLIIDYSARLEVEVSTALAEEGRQTSSQHTGQTGLLHKAVGRANTCVSARSRSGSQNGFCRITVPSGNLPYPEPVMKTYRASLVYAILRMAETPFPCLSVTSTKMRSGPCCAAAATASASVCAVAHT